MPDSLMQELVATAAKLGKRSSCPEECIEKVLAAKNFISSVVSLINAVCFAKRIEVML